MNINCNTKSITFPSEIKRTENRIKYIAIPALGILSGLAFTPETCTTPFEKIFSILDSTLIIYLIWLSVRAIIIRLQAAIPGREKNAKRLFFQFILSCIIGFIIIKSNDYLIYYIFQKDKNLTEVELLHNAVLLTILSFIVMLNSVYENFYLFSKLNTLLVDQEKYKKENIAAELQNIKNKINPHFLFNTFNVLSEITEEDPQRASGLIHELADVYRYVLNAQDEDWVLLKDELNFASSYIELLKMRFEKNLKTNIVINNSCLNCRVLPLSLQLLLENVIKHNEISNKNPQQIDIYIEEDKYLVVKNKISLRKSLHPSTKTGLRNINQRYQFLTNEEIIIENDTDYFIVKLPLIK